jgi:hypothetical protein
LFTIQPGNIPTVTLPALPPGITSMNLYLTSAGGVAGSETLYATGITGTTYNLAVATQASQPLPPANNTAVVSAPGALPLIVPTGGGTSGGNLQSGNYFLKFTYTTVNGETTPSTESAQFTVLPGYIPRVTLPTLPAGVIGINLYLTPAYGASNSEVKYTSGVVSTIFDLAAAAPVGQPAPPTVNTASLLSPTATPTIVPTGGGVSGGQLQAGQVGNSQTQLNQNMSLGGNMSVTEWLGGTLDDLFADTTGDDNANMVARYRCVFVHNINNNTTLQNVVVWISAKSVGGSNIAIGTDTFSESPAGQSGQQAQAVFPDSAAPPGVVFTAPLTKPAGIPLGNIDPGQCRAFWVRKTPVNSGAVASSCTLQIQGDTGP